MSIDHFFWLSAAVTFAAFVQGTMGVGFAMIMAPVIGLLEPALLPVAVLLLMLPLNAYVAWREHAAIDRVGAGWITVGRISGTAGGLWVLAALTTSQLALFVSLSILAAVAITLLMPKFNPGRSAFLGAGLVTGITETATGVGGPPLALALQHQPPAAMRATIATCFLVGEVLSVIALTIGGRAHSEAFYATWQLLPALIGGAFLSRYLHRRVDARFMRGFVLVFATVSALALLIHMS